MVIGSNKLELMLIVCFFNIYYSWYVFNFIKISRMKIGYDNL